MQSGAAMTSESKHTAEKDIVERLRDLWWIGPNIVEQRAEETAKAAADEIERLRAEKAELLEALEAMLEGHKVQHTSPWVLEKASKTARSLISRVRGET